MQMEAFATPAGVDLKVRWFGVQEANTIIAALLELVAHLVGIMRANWAGHEGQGRKGADGAESPVHGHHPRVGSASQWLGIHQCI
jgi:hypothetical protein